MNPKTAIVVVALAGAGLWAWWYFQRQRPGLSSDGTYVPVASGFDYYGAVVGDARTRPPDAPVVGIAGPRPTAGVRTTSTQLGGNLGYTAGVDLDVSPEGMVNV